MALSWCPSFTLVSFVVLASSSGFIPSQPGLGIGPSPSSPPLLSSLRPVGCGVGEDLEQKTPPQDGEGEAPHPNLGGSAEPEPCANPSLRGPLVENPSPCLFSLEGMGLG